MERVVLRPGKKRHYATIKERIIKGSIWLYPGINLSNGIKEKRFYIHRLLAIAFIPNPDNKPQINHIDGNKNNYSISNLEWVTGSENMKHANKTGLSIISEKLIISRRGQNNPNVKLKNEDIPIIKDLLKNGNTCIEIAKMFNAEGQRCLHWSG